MEDLVDLIGMNNIIFFHKNARRIRKDKKATLTDIEKLTGYSRSLISEWEVGKKKPKLDQIALIAKIYDVPVEKLCNINTSKEVITPNNQANDLSYFLQKGNINIASNIDRLSDNLNLLINYFQKMDIIFYVKNIHNQYISYSQKFLDSVDIRNINHNNSKSDYDFFIKDEAEKNAKEDIRLIKNRSKNIFTYTRNIFGQLDRLGEYSKKIIFNENQEVIGLFCFIRDITAEREKEELQNIVSISMTQQQGLVIEQVYPFHKYYLNSQAAINNFGNYEQKPENFWKWMKYIHPKYLDLKVKLGRHIPVPFPHRYMTLLANGESRWIEQTLHLKRLSSGQIIRIGYQNDITDIMRYREQRIITRLMEKTLAKHLLNFKMTSINQDVKNFNEPYLKEVLKEIRYNN